MKAGGGLDVQVRYSAMLWRRARGWVAGVIQACAVGVVAEGGQRWMWESRSFWEGMVGVVWGVWRLRR